MRNYFRWVVLFVLAINLCACHSSSKKYKDVLREGSWYVYDIDYSYRSNNRWMSPPLKEFINFMLEEENLLFLPGDELVFSNKHISVRCPNGDAFSYDYRYYGSYLWVDGYLVDPDGDDSYFELTFDKYSLEAFVENLRGGDEYYAYILDAIREDLRDFHITYYLQRPIPRPAQVMSGIYVGPLYNLVDSTYDLMNEASTVNLFWENNKMYFSMEEDISLLDGPRFHLEVGDLLVEETRPSGSYVFEGLQSIEDPEYGLIEINLKKGRFNVSNTVSAEIVISWNNEEYYLFYEKGVRQWIEPTSVKSEDKSIILRPRKKE